MAELHLGGLVDPATHERTGEDLQLDAADLTTHGVIVGMTGSGKTGLGIVLVEEVLRAGLPALLIDPKGDLTNLALTFPLLSAAEFRPWIDEGQAKADGQTSDDFAAAQATTWRDGLASWGYGPDQITGLMAAADVTVYTPGSRAGVPINIVGSLQAPDIDDAEVIGDEIESVAAGLLGLVGIDADPLSSREHILLSNLVAHAWSQGQALDLAALVGQVQQPPIRKLGVFELDQFFPAADRTALAMKLNGLLAAPSFTSWAAGQPLDIQAMLYTAEGSPRGAVITTSHLSDEERQFVTSMLLAKVVTWMRRQSGTAELRALLYMDEVVGYLPPTENPPTKKPIMTMMKQARAFGLGVVLATQNPVDIDYKAIANAGTWMIGRLQTARDKQRLLDGMSSAAGGVDVDAVGDTISGLARREFVLRRAGTDQPEVFTTRWAMSYLRGPMTRDQISSLDQTTPGAATAADAPTAAAVPAAPAGDPTTTSVMPDVAGGVAVRWADLGASWLTEIGGDPTATSFEAAVVARVHLRYDDVKADLVHDEEYEAVLFPLSQHVDVTLAVGVDHDDRDLRSEAPHPIAYRLTDAAIGESTYWKRIERDLTDHLARSRPLELPVNAGLDLYGRPGETLESFTARCAAVADERADAEIAELRDKYEAKASALRDKIAAAEDSAAVASEQHKARERDDLLSTAGSVLGGLLGGRRGRGGLLGQLGRAMGKRARTTAAEERVEAATNKVDRLTDDLVEIEAELAEELTEIDHRWTATAQDISTVAVSLERADVTVTSLALVWVPVA